MATKANKSKPAKVAIGDQILIEVAKWNIKERVACSLREFRVNYEMQIKSLVATGYLEMTANRKFNLTPHGVSYVKKRFPDLFPDKTEAF